MDVRYNLIHVLNVALLLWLESEVSPMGTLGQVGAWLGQAWLSTCSEDHAVWHVMRRVAHPGGQSSCYPATDLCRAMV